MKELTKAHWNVDEKTVQLGMEFSKVDKKRRMVAGWATVDNVDTEGDMVTSEASYDAFSRSRRNLREMHRKDSAVGRIVDFREKEFTAPDGNVHKGIFVKVTVSEGAEDTWKKVLDGTLNGFSIGGSIVESEDVLVKNGESIRKITKYDLTELSLVDNPGNQYSDITNVFKMRKSADGSVTSLTGMVEDTKMLNVFYCTEDELVEKSPSDSANCPVCEESMNKIGFIEDGSDRAEKVSTLVTKFRGEGGVTMAKVNNSGVDGDKNVSQESQGNPVDYVDDEQAELADPTGPDDEVGDVEESETEEPQDVEEFEDEGEEIAKRIDSLKTDIADILKSNSKATDEKIEALEKTVKETKQFFDKKMEEMDEKFDKFNQDLDTTKSRQADLQNALEKINSRGAIRKSADVDNTAETVQESETWGGAFSDPRGNGAFSVDNLFRG